MSYENLRNLTTQVREGILFITVSRPKVLNALNAETVKEIGRVFGEARNDHAVKAVIITGAGDKAFVAGADINELAENDPLSGRRTCQLGQETLLQIERFPKVVIAAINGFALGGGCELALACHLRVASEEAQIGLPEVALGIIPGYGGTQRMARLVGKGKALELILSGERVSAAEAERIGLVNRVVPADQLMIHSERMARTIVSRGPLAVQAAIEAINFGVEMRFDEGQLLEATLFGLLCASGDAKEGLRAFVEKRPAKFKGQ
jgi:enoyl-CoA hydratase